MVRTAAIGMAALIGLAACGSTPVAATPSATSSAAVTPTAGPTSAPLIVVAETDSSGVTSDLKLYDLAGRLVTTFPVKKDVWPLAATGKRIFVQSSGRLKAIDRTGSIEDLGPLAVGPNEVAYIIPSPDGTHWLWRSSGSTSSGADVTSIHEAGDGMSDRVVATGTKASPLQPYEWTTAAVMISHYPGFPFGLEAVTPFAPRFFQVSLDTLDLVSGTSTFVPGSDHCQPGDISVRRLYACFVPGQSHTSSENASRVLRLMPPTGPPIDVQLAKPQFTEAGDAWFSPSGTVLTLGGWDGTGHFNYPGQPPSSPPVGIHTYLVSLTGTITPFGPAGVQPALRTQTWLPGGLLLLRRQNGAIGGDPGLFVLDQNGQGPFIRDPGSPVGVIS